MQRDLICRMGRWMDGCVAAEGICDSEPYVQIRTGSQLVVGGPGSGEEVVG